MRKTALVSVVVVFCNIMIFVYSCYAGTTVQELYHKCKKVRNPTVSGTYEQGLDDLTDTAFCFGYIEGIGALMQTRQEVCSPILNGAALQAFINWAEKNPARWDWVASSGVSAALAETWPRRRCN
jgi:hypothetical protein